MYNNCKAPKYIKQILTDVKGKIDSNTIIAGNFNTPLTTMDTSPRQKVNKETLALNDTLGQMELIDMKRKFNPTPAEYTFFSTTHGAFFKIDHILGHKTSLNNLKKIEIISSIFSCHNDMRLEINYKKKKI